jgi:hypothetical protein
VFSRCWYPRDVLQYALPLYFIFASSWQSIILLFIDIYLNQVDNPSYFCLLIYISIKLTIHHTFVYWYISQSSWQFIILLFIDIYLNQVDNPSYFCLLIYISIGLCFIKIEEFPHGRIVWTSENKIFFWMPCLFIIVLLPHLWRANFKKKKYLIGIDLWS